MIIEIDMTSTMMIQPHFQIARPLVDQIEAFLLAKWHDALAQLEITLVVVAYLGEYRRKLLNFIKKSYKIITSAGFLSC